MCHSKKSLKKPIEDCRYISADITRMLSKMVFNMKVSISFGILFALVFVMGNEGASINKCRAKECEFPRCVDPEIDEEGCCQMCPNGGNCWSDGKVIDAVNQNIIRSVGSGCWALCRCPAPVVYERQGADTKATCRFWCRAGGSYANKLRKYYSSWGKK